MIMGEWSMLEGRRLFTVSASAPGDGDVAQETARCIDAALAALQAAGFHPAQIVRSRLFTIDRDSRREASDARRVLLAGERRGASASFFDPARLGAGARVRIDLTALEAADAKTVVEYEPPIAPPKFVRLGGLVFLSGVTDTGPDLTAQVAAIGATIRASLAAAETHLGATRQLAVYLARGEDTRDALALVERHLAEARCPVTLTQVDGYSAPEKRIEIETTAVG